MFLGTFQKETLQCENQQTEDKAIAQVKFKFENSNTAYMSSGTKGSISQLRRWHINHGNRVRNALGLWLWGGCSPARSSLGTGLIVMGIRVLGGKMRDHWPQGKVSWDSKTRCLDMTWGGKGRQWPGQGESRPFSCYHETLSFSPLSLPASPLR